MFELDIQLKNADKISLFESLDKTKIQALKKYLKSGHYPKEVARKLFKPIDLKMPYDSLLSIILCYLILLCYEILDLPTQKKIIIFMSTMQDLWNNINEGMYSKHAMDLRNNTNLIYLLTKLDLILSEQHTNSFFPFKY